MPVHYAYLVIAILAETIGTSALNASAQFSRFWPSVLVVAAYGVSFYFLAQTLKFMPVGIVYAMWAGLGIVLISTAGWLIFGQKLDLAAGLGIGLIVAGVIVIHLFSDSATH